MGKKYVKKVKDPNISIEKLKARRKRGNEAAKLKRLKQRFSGTGMRKRGLFKEARKKQSVENSLKKSRPKKKETPIPVLEDSLDETQESLSVADEGNKVSYVTSAFTAEIDINLERRIMLENEINEMEMLSQAVEATEIPIPIHERVRKPWSERIKERSENWENSKEFFFKAFVSSKAYTKNVCSKCSGDLNMYVKCMHCQIICCYNCDKTEHLNSPFHERILFSVTMSQNLLPTNFIDHNGKVITQGTDRHTTFQMCTFL